MTEGSQQGAKQANIAKQSIPAADSRAASLDRQVSRSEEQGSLHMGEALPVLGSPVPAEAARLGLPVDLARSLAQAFLAVKAAVPPERSTPPPSPATLR